MTLDDLAIKHNTDKHWHQYCHAYETHLGRLKDEPVRLMEIGVASGASMRMWNDYFTHPDAELIGVDIDPDCYHEIAPRVSIVIADGTQLDFTYNFDVIIDDGSHVSKDILDSFDSLWPLVLPGGWYVIEDFAVQWRRDYGGGRDGSAATKFIHQRIDSLLNRESDHIADFHIYQEIVFMRKNDHL